MTPLGIPHEAKGLAAALTVGLLIGLERGWHERDLPEGGRVAGLRTFALTGLLGGVLGNLFPEFGAWPLLGGLLGISMLLAVSYTHIAKSSGNLSATSAVAMLLTLVLGAYAARGSIALSLGAAVIAAVLLDMKPTLHGWLRLIEHRELTAALQLLVLSVVILPNLPSIGLGPYKALNPFQLWWAVILIASLSMVGHVAMRLTGSQRGILLTGLLGGLASSTAATLTLARFARQQPSLERACAAGAVGACGVMFFRMVVLLGVIQPTLLVTFGAALVVTGIVLLGISLLLWRRLPGTTSDDVEIAPMAPFDLGSALGFGVFLAVMAILVPAAKDWWGAAGIYAVSVVSGLADVDAIVISLARIHVAGGLGTGTVVVAMSAAVLANLVTKALIAWVTGGTIVGKTVGKAYAVAMAVGAATLALTMLPQIGEI
ncbi:MgtC/SapB family protein [Cupriavidus oxalaticus]|uniref:MgtC/SapB family protein n=1 Tax=Cupriavidus oxalaticus TaxID=96344 RepID=A0A4P7LHT3_9BURK|nr:MgtC/SapB family protein [Cupriavidus oxalaticus]QBY55794.1 MgtC/SapB family protein [Cupriavidus oxalaticus]